MTEDQGPEQQRPENHCHGGDYVPENELGKRWVPCDKPQTSPIGPYCDKHGMENFDAYLRRSAQ